MLVYSLIGLLAAVVVAVFLSRGGGQVILVFSGYNIRTSLGIFIFILFAGFALLYLLLRMISGLTHIPARYRGRQQAGMHGKAEYYLTRGFIALDEGDWEQAEKLFKRGIRYSRWPAINYIGAARAAHQLAALDRRDAYLEQARSASAESAFAAGIVRAELELDQQQIDQAYTTLKQLDADNPVNPRVRAMMLEIAYALKDWRQMLEILNEYERKGGMPPVDIHTGQLQAWKGLLSDASRSGDMASLITLWQNIPAKLKKEQQLVQVYVAGRLKFGDSADCEPLLREAIREDADPALIILYGQVQAKDVRRQLAYVEKLLAVYPENSELFLAAGRLNKRMELWGRARHCLEESLKISPSAAACYELATMFESQGDTENANKYFREGLKLTAG